MTGTDILRLQKADHSFWDFGCRWQDEGGAISQNYAPQIYFADEPTTPFVVCIRQVPSEVIPGTDRCRFLSESVNEKGEITAGCSVYDSRPAACRVFPLKFSPTRELVQLENPSPPKRASQHPAYQLCPRPWTTDDVDHIESAGILASAEYEMEFFKSVVNIWNRSVGPWEAFPNFIDLVYRRRVQVDSPREILPMSEHQRPAPATDQRSTPRKAA